MRDSLDRVAESLQEIRDTFASIGESLHNFADWCQHWTNPANWPNELEALLSSEGFENGFLAFTLILIIIRMLGAKWPTKWIFWGWVIYWILRVIL